MAINHAKRIWDAVLGELQLQVTRPSYETWLKDTVGIDLTDEEFVVGTPSAFVAEMLEQRMYSLISQATEKVCQGRVDVRFQVLPHDSGVGPGPAPVIDEAPPTDELPASRIPSTINPRYTFDTFIVGKSNELAHAAATAVADSPGNVYNPLVIYSDVGLGKTHLLHAIGHRVLAKGLSLIYATTEEFTNEYIKAIRDGKTEDFRNRYRSADALLLDDIQFLIGKEQTQEGFFHTFNALHMSNRQVVITSDRPVTGLTLLEDRVRSRLAGGLVVDIQAPDIETRLAILRAKAEGMRLQAPAGVLEFLSERVHRNIRDLEGTLNRIVAYAQLTRSPISLDLAKRAMADILDRPRARAISDEAVLDAVASHFQLPKDELKGRKRDKKTALARQVAMYLLREEANLGASAIGRILGGKDHTTVLYGCDRITSQLNLDAGLRRDVLSIRETLQSG